MPEAGCYLCYIAMTTVMLNYMCVQNFVITYITNKNLHRNKMLIQVEIASSCLLTWNLCIIICMVILIIGKNLIVKGFTLIMLHAKIIISNIIYCMKPLNCFHGN